jgi:hypothetical protein
VPRALNQSHRLQRVRQHARLDAQTMAPNPQQEGKKDAAEPLPSREKASAPGPGGCVSERVIVIPRAGFQHTLFIVELFKQAFSAAPEQILLDLGLGRGRARRGTL